MSAQFPRSKSDFHNHGIDDLRAMVSGSNPQAVRKAGDNWKSIADQLGGEDGSGGLAKEFQDAVTEASKSWSGQASKKFSEAAADVLKKIQRTYQHARNTQLTLIGNGEIGSCTPGMDSAAQIAGPGSVAQTLAEAKYTMEKIDDPSKVERGKDKLSDGGRDDSQFHADMADPNKDMTQILEANRGNLSVSKERQVEAVIVMETLAGNYRRHRENMVGGGGPEDGSDWPSQPGNQTPVAPVPMPIPGGAGATKNVALQAGGGSGIAELGQGMNAPRADGISGGIGAGGSGAAGATSALKPGADVGMGLSSAGGTGVAGGGSGLGNLSNAAGTGSAGGGSGTGAGQGIMGGAGGGAGAGSGAGSRAGRMGGMPGMGGAGAGGAKGAGKAGGGRGSLAKQRGGVVGAAGGKAANSRGGSGLHRSRGGSQAGKPGGARGAGMAGAGARGAGAKDDKDRGKERPDYLVEDEETWTPKRNVTPKVVE